MEYMIEEVTKAVNRLIEDCGIREKANRAETESEDRKLRGNAVGIRRKSGGVSGYKRPLMIAIDGRCCAGKTTLAEALKERNGWSVFHMDDFFLRPEQRTKERLAQPGGNVDYERFLEEILIPIKNAETKGIGNAGKTERITYRPFDCRRQDFAEEVTVEAGDVVIVEGSYSCHPVLRDAYDLRIFLDVSREEQERRLLARNGEEGAAVFREKWIPLEEHYFEACRVREVSDIMIGVCDTEANR